MARAAPAVGFTPGELRRLRALRHPGGIQRALEAMPYHLATTAWSPRRVLREGTAHCLEGAIFAAAALQVLGFPPLLLDLEAVQDTDHVLAVFRVRGHWGAIAKSNFSGLRYREPVYRSLRELVMSYFDGYLNHRGERTLRGYSAPVDLRRFDRRHPGWAVTDQPLWWVPEHLAAIPHRPVITGDMARDLRRAGNRGLAAALVGFQARPPRAPASRRDRAARLLAPRRRRGARPGRASPTPG
jgi:hypothetical protein